LAAIVAVAMGSGCAIGADGPAYKPARAPSKTTAYYDWYYSLPVYSWRMTIDYQLIANPAYNRDRGPVSVIGTRFARNSSALPDMRPAARRASTFLGAATIYPLYPKNS
jgi:hypothetical protein